MRKVKRENDLGRDPVGKLLVRLAVPTVTAQLVNALYNIVDRMYIGHIEGVGDLALTGLGVCFPVIMFVSALSALVGVGGGSRAVVRMGSGDQEGASAILGSCATLLVILSLVFTLVLQLVKAPMLYLFGASDATFPYADAYLTIYLMGTIFVMISLGLNPFINSQGFAKTGMMTVGLGAVVNIVLDPVFIFALDMGVRGAALATILAQGCSAAWVLRFLTGKRAILRLRLSRMSLAARRVKKILSLGLAGFFVNLTNSLVQVVCNATLETWGGDLYVGVMTIVNSIREVVSMPLTGVSNGAQPVLGFNYGGGEYRRVRQGIRFTAAVVVAYSVAAWAVIMLFPELLIRLFTTEAELVAIGVPALRTYFALFMFMSLQMAGQSIFTALGRAKNAIFFSLLRKAFINAPLTLLLPLWLGTSGVFVAEAVSQLLGGLACFTTMYFVVYRPMGRLEMAGRQN